jgi:ABC-type glycerol-3-phosphate transport system permease component
MRLLVFWAFISLFPIYWTITTSFKTAVDVTQGHLIPFVDFTPGLERLALARPVAGYDLPTSTVRDEFIKRFLNSIGHPPSALRSWPCSSGRWRLTASAGFPTSSSG